MSTVTDVLSKVVPCRWSWTLTGIESLTSALSSELHSAVDGRNTYRLGGGATLSIYFEGQIVEFVEITIESMSDLDELSPTEYEKVSARLLERFENVVTEASGILGPATVYEGPDAIDFPSDRGAERLALWNHPSGRIMIEVKHEDRELPMLLSIVLAPFEATISNLP